MIILILFQVTSSCTSVYVDGSEPRGALEASIDVKYGSFSGNEKFTVWMPKVPMNIELGDTKLSQVKSWRIPSDTSPNYDQLDKSKLSTLQHFSRTKRSKQQEEEMKVKASGHKFDSCNPRYQQTKVRVFAEFSAEDPDSGRKEYFPSRGVQLDVTELLIKRSLRVTNSRIATLRGNVIYGRAPGKTDIKVEL